MDLEAAVDDRSSISAGLNLDCISGAGLINGSRKGLGIAIVPGVDGQDAGLD